MRSLEGLCVLNTRPLAQGLVLGEQIHHYGGVSIDCPVLEIEEIPVHWDTLPDLKTLDYALFVSANAVAFWCKQLKEKHLEWPVSVHVIAIGEGTAKALLRHQIQVHELPSSPDSEQVLTLLKTKSLYQHKVALFKGEGGRPLIENYLRQQQATLYVVPLYQRTLPSLNKQFLHSLWRDDNVDIILLTSEQSIQNLFLLFDQEMHSWLCSKSCLVLSERLAQVALDAGFKKIIISHPNRIIDSLFDYKD